MIAEADNWQNEACVDHTADRVKRSVVSQFSYFDGVRRKNRRLESLSWIERAPNPDREKTSPADGNATARP